MKNMNRLIDEIMDAADGYAKEMARMSFQSLPADATDKQSAATAAEREKLRVKLESLMRPKFSAIRQKIYGCKNAMILAKDCLERIDEATMSCLRGDGDSAIEALEKALADLQIVET